MRFSAMRMTKARRNILTMLAANGGKMKRADLGYPREKVLRELGRAELICCSAFGPAWITDAGRTALLPVPKGRTG